MWLVKDPNWRVKIPMLLSVEKALTFSDSPVRMMMISVEDPVLQELVVVIANDVRERLADRLVEEEEVEESKERFKSMMSPSQLSEPIPTASAAPKKVRVKYLCHAHAFRCGAE